MCLCVFMWSFLRLDAQSNNLTFYPYSFDGLIYYIFTLPKTAREEDDWEIFLFKMVQAGLNVKSLSVCVSSVCSTVHIYKYM